MNAWARLLAAELLILRRMVVTRAVLIALAIGVPVVVASLRLVAASINEVVSDPGEVVLGTAVLLAAVGMVALAASALGQEYDLGTGRARLMRGPSRAAWITAKAGALLVVVTGGGLCAVVIGVLAAAAAGWRPSAGQVADLLLRAALLLPLGCLGYLGIVALGAVLGRSTAAGMLAGLVLFLTDFLLVTFRTDVGFSDWMPVRNLLTLLGGVFQAVVPAEPAVDPSTAVARLLLAGGGLLAAGGLVFVRQDQNR